MKAVQIFTIFPFYFIRKTYLFRGTVEEHYGAIEDDLVVAMTELKPGINSDRVHVRQASTGRPAF